MKRLWVHREIDAPADIVWDLLTDLRDWPNWGPTVRAVHLDASELSRGATGTVTTVLGLDLPFEVTDYDHGVRWAWKVAGVSATDHTVQALAAERCRAGFGVPWLAAPYLAVCRVALARLEALAREATS